MAQTFLTDTNVSCIEALPETVSHAVSNSSASDPPLSATKRCHFDFLPYPCSMNTQSGLISWVTRALSRTDPTLLFASTRSPSPTPSESAAVGLSHNRFSGANWLSHGLFVLLA